MFSSCCGRSFVWPWEEVHLTLVKEERRVSLNCLYKDFIIGFRIGNETFEETMCFRACGVEICWTGSSLLGKTYEDLKL